MPVGVDLGLDAALMRAIEREGYTIPTPIQAKAIPEVLAGRDVLAWASDILSRLERRKGAGFLSG